MINFKAVGTKALALYYIGGIEFLRENPNDRDYTMRKMVLDEARDELFVRGAECWKDIENFADNKEEV